MTRTIHIVLRLAVTIIGALWCDLHQAQSQDHVFANPPMLSSRDGRLDVDLVASPGTYTINGHQFQGMLYNSAYIPPVWRVRLRDTLTVTLHNRLSEPTNLHFHGLGVSPLGNGDNVFLHVRPGETFTYQVKIPEKHVGFFWFHPHMHGNVDQQIIGGMSGGIIVEGSDRLYPFLKNLTERIVLFKHHPIGRADFAGAHSPWPPPFAPPTPRRIAPLCSPASQLLWRGPTSRVRASSASAPHLPDAGRQRRRRSGQTRDLPASDAIPLHVMWP